MITFHPNVISFVVCCDHIGMWTCFKLSSHHRPTTVSLRPYLSEDTELMALRRGSAFATCDEIISVCNSVCQCTGFSYKIYKRDSKRLVLRCPAGKDCSFRINVHRRLERVSSQMVPRRLVGRNPHAAILRIAASDNFCG